MNLEYEVARSDRKSISIQINREGHILVRAPKFMSDYDIDAFVDSKSDWIEKNLEELQREIDSLSEENLLTEKDIEKLRGLAESIIPMKVAYYARLLDVTYGKISIRMQKTRWGSCSPEGNLNFNCLLMMAPPEVLDYVVVHELCHRIEMNHSARFWAQVEKVMPQYRVPKKWLKEHGGKLMMRSGN